MDAIDMWVTSMSSGDFDLSLLAEDARIWHSTDGLEMSVAEERALLESMRSAGRGVRTSGTRVRRHGGGAVLEYTLHVGESDGSTRDIPAVATVAVVDGRIARIDEYLLQEGEGVRDRSQWEVGRAPLADAHDRIFGDITRFGLERNVVELEVYGYTVLPPDVVGQPGLADRLLPEILAIAEKQTGVRADLAGGDGYGDMQAALGRGLYLNNMLMRGRVFEEALMNEPSLSLISYLLGEHCVLNQQSMMVKGPGGGGPCTARRLLRDARAVPLRASRRQRHLGAH